MSILSVNFSTTGLSGIKPGVIQINTNNTLAEVIVTGYLNPSINIYGNIYSNTQMALVNTTDQGPAWFRVVVEGVNASLVPIAEQGTVSSVGITGSDFTITNSPITSNGNIGLTLNTVPLNKGGTNNNALVASVGGIVWSDATKLQILPGTIAAGQVLVSGSNSAPTWQSVITPTFVGKNQLVYGIETDETAGLPTFLNGTLVTNNTGAPSILAGPGTTGNILQSNASAAPSFSTATYPSTTIANQLLYSNNTNTVTGLASIASGTLVTNGSSVPSISQTLPSAVQTNITALGTQAQALNMGGYQINAVAEPIFAQDVATKAYVDTVASGLIPAPPVNAATISTLTVTYNNGVAGVGATLTNAGTQVALIIDGISLAVTQRVLIKNQSSAAQNGIYTVTNIGSISTNWVLTRATDFDTPAQINTTGLIPVLYGTLNASTAWLLVSNVTTIGADSINFAQFGVTLPVTLANGGTSASLVGNKGGIFYSDTATGAILAGTPVANRALLSGATDAPIWSSATYPASTVANELLYSNGSDTIEGLTSIADGALITDISGVPSISQTLPSAVQTNITALGVQSQALDMNTHQVNNVVDPTSAQDAATKNYVDTTGVLSVNGTLNEITVSPTTGDVIVGLSSSYVGQTSITTLGTITSGTWNAGIIPLAYGGTNANLSANNGGIFYSTASEAAILAGTSTANQILLSGSTAAPTWSSATYPTSTTVNRILYSSSANVIDELTTNNNGLLVTSSSGVPSILAGSGTSGNMLQSNASAAPSFSAATYPSTTTSNQLLYSSSNDTVTGLSSSANGVLVTNGSSVPSISQTLPSAVQTNITALGVQSADIVMGGNTIYDIAIDPGFPTSVATLEFAQNNALAAASSNMLFNGSMLVWQRGITLPTRTTGFGYSADRWQYGTSGTSSVYAQQIITGTIAKQNFLSVGRTSGNSSTAEIKCGQSLTSDMCLEANNYRSPNILLTFDAACGTTLRGFNTLFVKVTSGTNSTNVSNLSTGFTGPVDSISTSVTLTTTKSVFAVQGVLPPTEDFTQLAVEFSVIPSGTATSADYFAISNVQLRMSSVVNFSEDLVNYAEEINRCSYFYQLCGGANGYAASATAAQLGVTVSCPMRSTPTVSSTRALVMLDGVSVFTASSINIFNSMTSGYGGLVQVNNFSGLTATRPLLLLSSFSNNFFTLDSELY
ncbi:MAG: tail fiber protein [Caudoviricetes sp.]|nr:MAG: tail fiber protein [Caudoviricetes sp.]